MPGRNLSGYLGSFEGAGAGSAPQVRATLRVGRGACEGDLSIRLRSTAILCEGPVSVVAVDLIRCFLACQILSRRSRSRVHLGMSNRASSVRSSDAHDDQCSSMGLPM